MKFVNEVDWWVELLVMAKRLTMQLKKKRLACYGDWVRPLLAIILDAKCLK